MNLYHFETACLSGTFSVVHEGLEEFLDGAFRLAERVMILVAGDELAQSSRPYLVPTLDVRLRRLQDFLLGKGYMGRFEIAVCSDAWAEADAWLNPRIDALVVSEEMFMAADITNRQRRRLGLKTFTIHVMDRKFGADGEVLSATRLLQGVERERAWGNNS